MIDASLASPAQWANLKIASSAVICNGSLLGVVAGCSVASMLVINAAIVLPGDVVEALPGDVFGAFVAAFTLPSTGDAEASGSLDGLRAPSHSTKEAVVGSGAAQSGRVIVANVAGPKVSGPSADARLKNCPHRYWQHSVVGTRSSAGALSVGGDAVMTVDWQRRYGIGRSRGGVEVTGFGRGSAQYSSVGEGPWTSAKDGLSDLCWLSIRRKFKEIQRCCSLAADGFTDLVWFSIRRKFKEIKGLLVADIFGAGRKQKCACISRENIAALWRQTA
ncbi:hypothetical protein SUGI_0043390 [Cryptomeria japonica]|nr:hypothetical protein SUGI_0043390 [Cryptomeria japonica]